MTSYVVDGEILDLLYGWFPIWNVGDKICLSDKDNDEKNIIQSIIYALGSSIDKHKLNTIVEYYDKGD